MSAATISRFSKLAIAGFAFAAVAGEVVFVVKGLHRGEHRGVAVGVTRWHLPSWHLPSWRRPGAT